MQALGALFQSRKFIATLLAVAGGVTLCAMGKVSPDNLMTFIGALTAVLVGSIAAEDAAAKRNPGNVNSDNSKVN